MALILDGRTVKLSRSIGDWLSFKLIDISQDLGHGSVHFVWNRVIDFDFFEESLSEWLFLNNRNSLSRAMRESARAYHAGTFGNDDRCSHFLHRIARRSPIRRVSDDDIRFWNRGFQPVLRELALYLTIDAKSLSDRLADFHFLRILRPATSSNSFMPPILIEIIEQGKDEQCGDLHGKLKASCGDKLCNLRMSRPEMQEFQSTAYFQTQDRQRFR